MKQNKVYIYGRHAVEEALRHARHALNRIYADKRILEKAFVRELDASGVALAPLAEGVARGDLERGSAHQGVMAQVLLSELVLPQEKFFADLTPSAKSALVLLAGIEDPHNLGAIIRSAAGFGARAVLMPQKGQAPVSATVIKVSAGAAFRLPLVSVANIESAVRELKKKGYRVYALAGEAQKSISDEAFREPAVFIFGNEGSGVLPHVRRLCDDVLAIPMSGNTESLNVAAAAAVTLYAWKSKQ